MSTTTVSEFALSLGKSPQVLLEQFRSAGVEKSAASDAVYAADKQRLLDYLRASHGTASSGRKKITLLKKSAGEIKQTVGICTRRTIEVRVRGKRITLLRDEFDETELLGVPDCEAPKSERVRVHNKVIVVGNLGQDHLTDGWQRRYDAALASIAEWLRWPMEIRSFADAARKLKAVFEVLRGKLRLALRPSWDPAPAAAMKRALLVAARQDGFFHVGKVDGRNAP